MCVQVTAVSYMWRTRAVIGTEKQRQSIEANNSLAVCLVSVIPHKFYHSVNHVEIAT